MKRYINISFTFKQSKTLQMLDTHVYKYQFSCTKLRYMNLTQACYFNHLAYFVFKYMHGSILTLSDLIRHLPSRNIDSYCFLVCKSIVQQALYQVVSLSMQ